MCGACRLPSGPGTGPGLTVTKENRAVGVGSRAPEAREGFGVERQVLPVVCGVVVAARLVGLPDLDHRVGHGLSCPVVDRALDPHGPGMVRRNQLGAVLAQERVVEEGAYRLGWRGLGGHLWFSMGVAFLPSSTMSKR